MKAAKLLFVNILTHFRLGILPQSMLDQIYSCPYLGVNNLIFPCRGKPESSTIQTGILEAS